MELSYGLRMLRAAVVEKAVEDYEKALIGLNKKTITPNKRFAYEADVRACEAFFNGDNILMFTDIDGTAIQRQCRKNVEAKLKRKIEVPAYACA